MTTPTPTQVVFKHEDEIDGEPIGPMKLVFDDDAPIGLGQPYDPNRKVEWVTRTEALNAAKAANVPFKEV